MKKEKRLVGSHGNFVFSMDIAKEYGVDVAIFLQNIAFWIKSNSSNKDNFFDEKYFLHNTLEAFSKTFPCWSSRQMERIIKSAINDGLLIKVNHNKTKFNRTYWYTLTEKGLNLFNLSYEDISQNDKIASTEAR